MTDFEIPHDYVANRAPMDSDQQRCLTCDEPQSHAYHVASSPVKSGDWYGDSPFWLMCQRPEDGNVGIDIDVPGWVEEVKPLMREASTWILMDKNTSRPVFIVELHDGDQFYFAKRHVGNLNTAREVVCYGIGKKKADGTPVNLWLLPNGAACGGEDVEELALRML